MTQIPEQEGSSGNISDFKLEVRDLNPDQNTYRFAVPGNFFSHPMQPPVYYLNSVTLTFIKTLSKWSFTNCRNQFEVLYDL
jgi:hypothetical protein